MDSLEEATLGRRHNFRSFFMNRIIKVDDQTYNKYCFEKGAESHVEKNYSKWKFRIQIIDSIDQSHLRIEDTCQVDHEPACYAYQ